MKKKPNIILFVNKIPEKTVQTVKQYSRKLGRRLKTAVLFDSRDINAKKQDDLKHVDIVLSCDFTQPLKIMKTLLPYENQLLAVTCRGEVNVPAFRKVVPHLPYLRTPSTESLMWATDKIMMRQRFQIFDKSITPRFMVVTDTSRPTLQKIKREVDFPLILKPAGLAASLLVTICYHKKELKETLEKVFRKIKKVYKAENRKDEPRVLVEEFMEGEMYSIDGYVSARGTVYFCPPVHVKTGRSIGFDDFFGYQRLTPTLLKKSTIEKMESVASRAVRALGLRSTTVHIELMRTDSGWKVIELGPRIGGYRNAMYRRSYGINHSLNDILIRIPKKPVISRKVKGHTAVLQFFSKKEGKLKKIQGIKRVRKLKSCVRVDVHVKTGERCLFAKHGGRSVCDVYLFNKKRPDLLADIRRLEKMIMIQTP